MTTDRQERPSGAAGGDEVKNVTRIVMLIALLAAGLVTTACGGSSLYTGVDSNGGWNAPVSSAYRAGGAGIHGYPF
jgi:hypothetical protein